MDKLEYIPGDLVMTNGVPCGTAKGVVYKVTSSDPSKTFELDDETVLKGVVRLENLEGVEFGDKGYLFGDSCAWVKDIVPINLVPAILEKNGWKKYRSNIVFKDRGLGWIAYRHPNYPFTLRYDNILGMCDVSFNDGKNNLLSIESVHQLQHLLFGLGINNNMEV